MPRLALKVDADTYRGTLIGVPRLVELLRREKAGATFLFSLGPDHTGRAIKRVFRPGFFGKVLGVFGSSKAATPPLKYRIVVRSEGNASVVSVLDASGAPENSENAARIVRVIADDLK